ncbi:aminotransferase class I/II-fold pyridoxal phosphate-dependent enzyme [Helicobacter burdigaliensis]|uniref:aminotransferase class I/II-fold pyridoxal phosphate-dependent enzyme n=1 Tax=Helicobacter burdigaliensis TaxID=2315334 RepID=UPI000EF67447|nr:aminotransferase class I/II-fold pyridoxal phosphate-dependent enzyme [Helicobacter burdigaliensis]
MEHLAKFALERLKQSSNFRSFYPLKHEGLFVYKNGKKLLNLASNDYLNLSSDIDFKQEFLDSEIYRKNLYFSASSSRSLSGNFEIFEIFEEALEKVYGKKALLFNSGYHANIGAISSLANLGNVLFLADKSIHASHIDGLKSFKKVALKRFLHNDMQSLKELVEKNHQKYENIIILSEGLFSMEGDFAPLKEIVEIKKQYQNIYIYLDEAHSIGSFGENGYGVAYTLELLKEVDFLVLTFGKALGSVGACVLCSSIFRDYFVNFARSLIYSTAIPPLCVAMSYFAFLKLPSLKQKKERLAQNSVALKEGLLESFSSKVLGDYNIISLVLGGNARVISFQNALEEEGYFIPAIKSPTVPRGKESLRISLVADIKKEDLKRLIRILGKLNNENLF